MKNRTFLLMMIFTVSLMVAQSPCCKDKGKGVSCTRTAQAVDATQTADANKVLPACCKSKGEQGVSCSKKSQVITAETCSSKKWWQVWKNACDKPCCDKV